MDETTTSLPRETRVRVRPMTHADVADIVAMHVAHFPHNVAVRFGRRFVAVYVRLFIDSPAAIGRIATDGDVVVGYLLGVTSTGDHRAFSKRRVARLSIAALPRALPNLMFLLRVVARRVHVKRSGGEPAPTLEPPVAVLSHLAVLERARRTGIGADLVRSFEEAAVSRGARTAVLATVDGEDGAGDFYTRQGWRPSVRGTTVDQRDLRTFRKTFSGPGGTPSTPVGRSAATQGAGDR